MSDSSWVKEGVEVVIYRDTFDRRHTAPQRTRVLTVARKSFKVEKIDDRFNLDDQRTKQTGSRLTGASWVAVPVDSEKAVEVLAQDRREEQESAAYTAVSNWITDRQNDEKRRAAIRALTEFDPT